MKVYLVGGAVRDILMDKEPKDLDYVVVGSSVEEMLSLGYKQVGSSFPVFLHPDTGEEYALARREVKDGKGYNGFTCEFGPDVTLEEDLYRRDLTINSMAMDEDETVIDPYGGWEDLDHRILRHTSDAFMEDPVRVLRVARFVARDPSFTIHPELAERMERMRDELPDITEERLGKETLRALMEDHPSQYFRILTPLGVFPELEPMVGLNEGNRWHPEKDVFEHVMLSLDSAAMWGYNLQVRYGVLCHDLGKPEAYSLTNGKKSNGHEKMGVPIANQLSRRMRVPSYLKHIGGISAEYHTHIHISLDMKPSTIAKFLKMFRSEKDLNNLIGVAKSDKRGRGGIVGDLPYVQSYYIKNCWNVLSSIDYSGLTKKVAGEGHGSSVLIERIHSERCKAVSNIDKACYVEINNWAMELLNRS